MKKGAGPRGRQTICENWSWTHARIVELKVAILSLNVAYKNSVVSFFLILDRY